LDVDRFLQAHERPFQYEIQSVLDPTIHAGKLFVSFPEYRFSKLAEKYSHCFGSFYNLILDMQYLYRLCLGPAAFSREQFFGAGNLFGLFSPPHSPLPPPGAGY
jgi:hypothetical protein